jgi:hypothetical protein
LLLPAEASAENTRDMMETEAQAAAKKQLGLFKNVSTYN